VWKKVIQGKVPKGFDEIRFSTENSCDYKKQKKLYYVNNKKAKKYNKKYMK
jgi:hypothetical protein